MSSTRICPSCQGGYPDDANHFNPKFPDCFRCRSKGLSVSYGAGGREGKQMFHDKTTREMQAQTVREAAANGIEAVPAWVKPNFAPTSTGFKKLETTLNTKVTE